MVPPSGGYMPPAPAATVARRSAGGGGGSSAAGAACANGVGGQVSCSRLRIEAGTRASGTAAPRPPALAASSMAVKEKGADGVVQDIWI